MLLLIDNYDSFTYNLVHYLVISPGPCTPNEAGISLEVIKNFKGKIPILGVCLGHQCIGQAFGSKIIRAKELMHGKLSQIEHHGSCM